MKNRLLILLLMLLLFSSCEVYKPVTWYIGQNELEFLKANEGVNLKIVEASASRRVYARCNDYGYYCTYYYFRNYVMYQMDKGEAQPDVIIQNR